MPYFEVDNLSITPAEFVNECDLNEIDELIDHLIAEKYILRSQTIRNPTDNIPPAQKIFESKLDMIHGAWSRLSREQEEIITKIANDVG